MNIRTGSRWLLVFTVGFGVGLAVVGLSGVPANHSTVALADAPAGAGQSELATLRAEIERLKGMVPDQSHSMSDVDYHFSNLWFAGRAENWPLAEFYWKESLAHIKWAIRIIPVRKDNAGQEIKLAEILQSIEMSPSMQMGGVIERKDAGKFETTYRSVLEGCYTCHKAADKPYLRPNVPKRPASAIVNFDPQATWPK